MAIGTTYDYYLLMKAAKKRKHTMYDIEKRSKLDQSVNQHQKLSNGINSTANVQSSQMTF